MAPKLRIEERELEAGADADGVTPFEHARRRGYDEIVQILSQS